MSGSSVPKTSEAISILQEWSSGRPRFRCWLLGHAALIRTLYPLKIEERRGSYLEAHECSRCGRIVKMEYMEISDA